MVAHELATLLDAASAIAVRGHGELVSATQARFGSWHEFMQSSFDAGIAAAREHATLPAGLVDDLAAIRSTLGGARRPPSVERTFARSTSSSATVGESRDSSTSRALSRPSPL